MLYMDEQIYEISQVLRGNGKIWPDVGFDKDPQISMYHWPALFRRIKEAGVDHQNDLYYRPEIPFDRQQLVIRIEKGEEVEHTLCHSFATHLLAVVPFWSILKTPQIRKGILELEGTKFLRLRINEIVHFSFALSLIFVAAFIELHDSPLIFKYLTK